VRDLQSWLILLILVTAGVTAAGYMVYAKNSASVEMHKRADVIVSELLSILSVPLYNIDHDSVQHISKIFLRIPDIIAISVEDEQGEIVFDTIAQKDHGLLKAARVSKDDSYMGRVVFYFPVIFMKNIADKL